MPAQGTSCQGLGLALPAWPAPPANGLPPEALMLSVDVRTLTVTGPLTSAWMRRRFLLAAAADAGAGCRACCCSCWMAAMEAAPTPDLHAADHGMGRESGRPSKHRPAVRTATLIRRLSGCCTAAHRTPGTQLHTCVSCRQVKQVPRHCWGMASGHAHPSIEVHAGAAAPAPAPLTFAARLAAAAGLLAAGHHRQQHPPAPPGRLLRRRCWGLHLHLSIQASSRAARVCSPPCLLLWLSAVPGARNQAASCL